MLLDLCLPHLPWQLVATLLILFFPLHLFVRISSRASIPKHLPWAGPARDGRLLSRAWATLMSFGKTREYSEEGYYKHSKNGKTYVLPHLLTGPEVILPLSQMKWLLEQPDCVLSQMEINRQFLEADYTMLHPNIIRDTVHAQIIRRELTSRLGDLNADIVDELEKVLGDVWGLDTKEWREVPVYDTMLELIARISNRVLVGEALCRDPEYLSSSKTFARTVVVSAAFINLLPRFLRPILGPIITLYDKFYYWKCAKYTIPLVRQRLTTSGQFDDKPQQNDYIQWSLRHAATNPDPYESTPEMISRRLAVLSFAAIQSSVITITNTLFDMLASPYAKSNLEKLRKEVYTELSKEQGAWTKASLAKMVHIDSALRESMRLGGFVSRGLMKMVVAPDGVTLPDGTNLRRGTKVGVSAYNVHHDADIYPHAQAYNAFRFSDPGCEAAGEKAEKSSFATGFDVGKEKQTMVTTSPIFMAFSHGNHACPGRFFAANQLKLTLAHIALNYEMKPISHRPVNKWFVGSIAPPLVETIMVRRRVGTVV